MPTIWSPSSRTRERVVEPLPSPRGTQGRPAAVPRAATATRPVANEMRPIRRPEDHRPVRLSLQQRAPRNLRRHVERAITRSVVLVIGDLLAFGFLRGAVRVVRDFALFGEGLATLVRTVMPPGILNGWQFAAALITGLLVTGNYRAGDRRRDPGRLFLGCALATALPLWMTIWTRGVELVAVHYTLTVMFVWLSLVLERKAIDLLVARRPRRAGRDGAATLFVGRAPECQAMADSAAFRGREFQGIGFVDVERPCAVGAVGHIEEFPLLLAASGAEIVVVCGAVRRPEFQSVVDSALASGCQVLAVPPEVRLPGVEPAVVWRDGKPLIQLTVPSLRGQQLVVKRIVDFIGALAGLVVLSPLFALIGLIIKWDSAGPVFFRQTRVGRGGREFRIIKFRTMGVGADGQLSGLRDQSMYTDGRLFKMREDPRVTRVGRLLRRSSLDELPQLLNVLRGEMSLVGPRPPLPSEVDLYEEQHYARFDVKPGMTGPWQVSGRNEIDQFEDVVKLETRYIREWSLFSDIVILAKTVRVVLGMRGAH
jgi:exopolysaccharide biosynthesis polyprenyl glycosylphosphotransferase